MNRKRKYGFKPAGRQADKTFLVASLFEGSSYVGIFDNRTGERIGTLAGDEPGAGDIPEEEPPTINKNQLSLF